MSYNVASSLFNTETQALRALCGEFLSAGGHNDIEDQIEYAEDAEHTAQELIDNWGGTIEGVDTTEDRTFTKDEIIAMLRDICDELKAEAAQEED